MKNYKDFSEEEKALYERIWRILTNKLMERSHLSSKSIEVIQKENPWEAYEQGRKTMLLEIRDQLHKTFFRSTSQ